MDKKNYESPRMEVIRFEAEDIITTSGPDTGDYGTDIIPDSISNLMMQ